MVKMTSLFLCILFSLTSPTLSQATTDVTNNSSRVTRTKSCDEEVTKWLDGHREKLRQVAVARAKSDYAYAVDMNPSTEKDKGDRSETFATFVSDQSKEAATKFPSPDCIQNATLKREMVTIMSLAAVANKNHEKLEKLKTKISSTYSKAKICPPEEGENCSEKHKVPLSTKIEGIMGKSRNESTLKTTWLRWFTAAGKPSKEPYFEAVKLIKDTNSAQPKRTPEDANRAEYLKLLHQMIPFYEDLHSFVRYKLQKVYGNETVNPNQPIPAHLLGNLWAQNWGNVYEIVRPYPENVTNVKNITKAMKAKKWSVSQMFHAAENFFLSLGFPNLPQKFWKESMLTQPKDAKVADCHARAYNIDLDDKRIKMCTKITQEDFGVVHHEIGHVYYYLAYQTQPLTFQAGASSAFHEAVGDTIFVSANSEKYLKHLGLLQKDYEATAKQKLNEMLKKALSDIPFFPYSLGIDMWRWDVLERNVDLNQSNSHWWEILQKYQGVKRPVDPDSSDFDPPGKYHISSFVSYVRYFTARFLQFQFHEALCRDTENMAECTIFNNTEAGKKFWEMLSLGSSKPWPEALEILTGTKQVQARPILTFYKPLRTWLRKYVSQKGLCVGWGVKWPTDVKVNSPRC